MKLLLKITGIILTVIIGIATLPISFLIWLYFCAYKGNDWKQIPNPLDLFLFILVDLIEWKT